MAKETTASKRHAFPKETSTFTRTVVENDGVRFTVDDWLSGLRAAEIKDRQQQINIRPWFAIAVFVLLVGQNIGIWLLVKWSLETGQLKDLQLILGTLVAATLTQSYFILRLITKKIFGDIDYHNNDAGKNES
ncbi:MAG TPA: hypothetical protein VLG09_05510 [Candidatus Saccharimonadales bacterium]|jgi:hypothetical protein|nr:hypothetical protein [Candidatus Saccharimonadales bacterium]